MQFHRCRHVLSLLRSGKLPAHTISPFGFTSLVQRSNAQFSTSTSSHTTAPPLSLSSASSVDSAPLAASILSKAKYHRVYDMLGKDKRVKIPQVDFFKICFENGLSTEEAKSLRTSLHDSGLILYFPRGSSEHSRLHDEIIIKPKAVSHAFMRALDVDHSYVNMYSIERKKQLEQLKMDIAPYEEQKEALEYSAHLYADRCIRASMVGLTAMSAGIVRLTFWDLSWDIMEPVTYMLNLATMTTSLYFFVLYGNEFAYPTLHERIMATRLQKYYRRGKFDIKKFEALTEKITKIERELVAPDIFYLRQLVAPPTTTESVDDDTTEESQQPNAPPPISSSPEKIAES